MLIQPITPDASLVYGMDWETLVGNKLDVQSSKRAGELKASHYIKPSGNTSSAGFVFIPKEHRSKGVVYYSAAEVFAQSNPYGVFYERTEFEDGSVWVVAAHDENIIEGTDKILSAEEADELIASLQARFAHIVRIETEFFEHEIVFHLNDRTRLHEVKTAIESIPNGLKYAFCLVLALVLIDTGWTKYKQHQAEKTIEQRVVPQIDPELLWKQAIDQWQQEVRLFGDASLKAAYEGLLDLPLDVGHWTLSEAGCAATQTSWVCDAHYKRGVGTNLSFKGAAPKNWAIKWSGLGGVIATWTIPAEPKPLNRLSLPGVDQINEHYISMLQVVLPSFKSYTLSPAEQVLIPPPRTIGADGDMMSVPYPESGSPEIKIPSLQRFTLEAPLRSVTVLPFPPLLENLSIKTIRFDYIGPIESPGLTSSAFTVKLSGELYAR